MELKNGILPNTLQRKRGYWNFQFDNYLRTAYPPIEKKLELYTINSNRMNRVLKIYKILFDYFGPQHWWPADTEFEIIVGAILMPQTLWSNVEKTIKNLKQAGLMTPNAIAKTHISRLKSLVKLVGFSQSKPRRLKNLSKYMMEVSDGDLNEFLTREPSILRQDLLSLEGIGPEIADSILLYAAKVPIFVVDTYTKRIGIRVGLFSFDRYDMIQEFFMKNVPKDYCIYKEYHALLVALAKETCRLKPRCDLCPLINMCDYVESR